VSRRADSCSRVSGFARPIALLAIALALVVAFVIAWPAIRQWRDASRIETARRDASAIAGALVRFYRDTGFFPLWDRVDDGGAFRLDRVDLLVGDGARPQAPSNSAWFAGRQGRLADELVTNRPSYAVREDPEGMGWNGPYLPDPPAADPWGRQYVVNIGLIPSADAPSGPGTAKYAVWVLSAGPDGEIQTPYRQLIADATLAGDDIGVRIQ
jgi:hypothetical protein